MSEVARPLVAGSFPAAHSFIGRQMAAGLGSCFAGRRTFRVITLVWGVGWLTEFAFTGINVGLFSWMFTYVRRQAIQANAKTSAKSSAHSYEDILHAQSNTYGERSQTVVNDL